MADGFCGGPDGAGRPTLDDEAMRRLCAAYDLLLAVARRCREREQAGREQAEQDRQIAVAAGAP